MFRLPVHTRITELGDGRREESLYVCCPVHGEVRPLLKCLECELAVDFPVEPDEGRQGSVVCRAAGAHHGPPRRRADEVTVASVMGERVTCVDVGLGLDELAEVLSRCGQRGVPVVDDDGRFVGIVSGTDLMRARPALGGAPDPTRTVADLMSAPVHTVRPECTVAEAAALMAREQVHQLPVVTADDEVIGLVESLDLARWIQGPR